jgi:hypothetical protein
MGPGAVTVSVLIPFGGPPCVWRARARAWVLDHYATHHPAWEVVLGHSPEPWSKGIAAMNAYARCSGDVLVIADADSYTDPATLATLTEEVVAGSWRWGMAHGPVHRLTSEATEALYAGNPPRLDQGSCWKRIHNGVMGGGIVVVTRDAWETVGGIDPRYFGWGGEDESFGETLAALVSLPVRHIAPLVHLWHPPGDRKPSAETDALRDRYKAAWRNVAASRAIVEEFKGASWPAVSASS